MVESRGVQNSALMFDSMRVRVRVFFKAKRGLLLGPGPVFFLVFTCFVARSLCRRRRRRRRRSRSLSPVIKVLFLIFDRSESAVNERCYARKIVHTLKK